MQWNATFSIGVEKIDNQHQRLFQLTTELEQELAGRQAAETVGKALKFLVEYTSYHFKDEESLMAQINYPDLEAHRALHKQLIDKVRTILLDIRAGRLPTVADLITFLYQWIVEHIEQEDKQIGAAIQELQRRSAPSDTPADIISQSTTHEIKANLTRIQALRKQQLITDTDVDTLKKALIDKFIRKFKPASMVEVVEEYNGLKALFDAGLIAEAELDLIRPRFAEKIDMNVMLAGDQAIEASLAHLNALVEAKLIDKTESDHHKQRLLKKIH